MKHILILICLSLFAFSVDAQVTTSTAGRIQRVTADPAGSTCTPSDVRVYNGAIYSCQSGVFALSGAASIVENDIDTLGKDKRGVRAYYAIASLPTCQASRRDITVNVTDGNKGQRTCRNTTGSTYAWVDDDPVYRPERFGAVGSGTETTALQALITAAAGKTVILTKGASYTVGSALTVPANTTIDLNGAIVTTSAAAAIFVNDTNAGGITIKNGTLVGTSSTYAVNQFGVKFSGTRNGATTAPTYATNFTLENLTISTMTQGGIELLFVDGVNAKNCTISNVGYTGVLGYSAKNVRVEGVIVDTITGETVSGELNAYGVVFTSLVNTSDFARDPQSVDCLVTKSKISNVQTWHALDTHGGIRIYFIDNDIKDSRRGVVLTNLTTIGASYCKVENNRILNTLTATANISEGVWDIGASTSIRNQYNEITGNKIFGHGAKTGAGGAVWLQNAEDGSFERNIIRDAWYSGLYIHSELRRYSIIGNDFIDYKSISVASGGGTDFPFGIFLVGDNIADTNISLNSFQRKNTAASTVVAYFGIYMSSTTTRSIKFSENIFDGVTTKWNVAAPTANLTGDVPVPPTVTSAGTSPSVVAHDGPSVFTVNVGTGGTASAIVLAMPTATTGWICSANNMTATAANRADQAVRQTASTTTSVTLQNQTVSTGAALAFTASDVVRCQCTAY